MVEGDSTSRLDINGRKALDVGDGGYFRRFSTTPTQDADIDLAAAIAAGMVFNLPDEVPSQLLLLQVIPAEPQRVLHHRSIELYLSRLVFGNKPPN